MGEGRRHHHHIVGAHVDGRREEARIGGESPVIAQHALRRGGGARGEAERREVFGPWPVGDLRL